jgi:glycosyltransferase involved in cell wall biosynthesis
MTDTSPAAPRVSVLMTTYNGARFIAESIDSVLGQTFGDFELVVVDDTSTDGTAAILARYADPRLRVIRNTTNLGVVGARNWGFAALRGHYVATIDHDDLWLPTRLAEGVARLDREPATVLVATQTLVLEDGRLAPVERPTTLSPLLFSWMLLMDCPVVYSSLLFRREAARQADGTLLRPDLRYADDYELMLRLAASGSVAALSEALTVYRVHSSNTTWKVRGEMYHHCVAALTERFLPWLGVDAAEAAQLIAWHVSRRNPATNRATLHRLGILLRRLTNAFVAAYRPGPEDRASIEHYAGEANWRVLRAGIRSGHIWLLGADRRGSARSVRALATPADVAVSLAAGVLRLPMLAFRSGRNMPPAVE